MEYTGQKTLNVVLKSDNQVLDDVVVIGYGSKNRKSLTSSISSVKKEDLNKLSKTSSTVQDMLGGTIKGVLVTQNSGEPGATMTVNVRGITSPYPIATSLTANNAPLYVIDGVPMFVDSNALNPLMNIAPNDIESIDVLKDASATAIYGSRAANGVVLVTTKRGKAGMKPQLEFSARYGIQTLNANDFRVLTADEYIRVSKAACAMSLFTRGSLDYFTKKYVDEAYFNSHINNSQFDLNTLTDDFYLKDAYGNGDTDWWDLMTRNAATQDYSIGIRGGSKESSYSASIYYKDQKGIVKGGNSKMLGGSFNFDAAVRDIVRFKLDLRATARTANDKDNMIGEILDMRPDVPAYKEDGTINEISYYVKNPLLSLMDTDEAKGRNFSGTLGLEWDIVKGLTFRTSATAQYNVNKYSTYSIAWYDEAESSASVSKNESYTYM